MIDTDKYEEVIDDDGYFCEDKIADLLAEVKRLSEENNRYLDFIFWLGIEHKGKKLAWEYGDGKIVEML